MAKHQEQRKPSEHVASERPSHTEETGAQAATLAQIKSELDAERTIVAARERAMAAGLASGNHPIKLAQLDSTAEQRAKAHADTVDFIRVEMEQQDAESEAPKRMPPRGIDEASIELIKAEMAKASKRVVLPGG